MRMLPRPRWPRAVQSGLWQNWACGSIGIPHEARFGDHAWRNAWWTRAFQRVTLPLHGSVGCYHPKSLATKNPNFLLTTPESLRKWPHPIQNRCRTRGHDQAGLLLLFRLQLQLVLKSRHDLTRAMVIGPRGLVASQPPGT